MDSKYTKKETEALDRKFEHPDDRVICPRCGKELKYYTVGNSSAVECGTVNCLRGTCRGL